MMEELNKEAEANDSSGIHAYSQDLVQMLVGNNAGSAYAASLTDRLAQAEFMARHGKRKLISEANIAQVFDAWMREIKAPRSLNANVDTVHRNRIAFESSLPAMISQKKNGNCCNPGEAIYVLLLMVENVGSSITPLSNSNSTPKNFVSVTKSPARAHLEQFYVSHSPLETAKMFDRLFNSIQI